MRQYGSGLQLGHSSDPISSSLEKTAPPVGDAQVYRYLSSPPGNCAQRTLSPSTTSTRFAPLQPTTPSRAVSPSRLSPTSRLSTTTVSTSEANNVLQLMDTLHREVAQLRDRTDATINDLLRRVDAGDAADITHNERLMRVEQFMGKTLGKEQLQLLPDMATNARLQDLEDSLNDLRYNYKVSSPGPMEMQGVSPSTTQALQRVEESLLKRLRQDGSQSKLLDRVQQLEQAMNLRVQQLEKAVAQNGATSQYVPAANAARDNMLRSLDSRVVTLEAQPTSLRSSSPAQQHAHLPDDRQLDSLKNKVEAIERRLAAFERTEYPQVIYVRQKLV